ncbi:hypothetical protein TcG_07925 [Trypanosoma cruzi]|nr:hypothetical protein TcG_07925 [Trypanosoma cruzi]
MREGCDATAAAHHNHLLSLHRHFFKRLCENFWSSHNILFCFTMSLLQEAWFWWLLHGASPCVLVAVLPRDAKAFDGVLTLLFESCSRRCLVMEAAVGLCGCVFVARIASSAVAASLCWWGVNERRLWWSGAPV